MKVINIPCTLTVNGCKNVHFFCLFKIRNDSDFLKFTEVLFLILMFIWFIERSSEFVIMFLNALLGAFLTSKKYVYHKDFNA